MRKVDMASDADFLADQSRLAVRDLGIMERVHFYRHGMHLDTCVVSSATYASADTVLDRTTLLRALERVVQEQPSLCLQAMPPQNKRSKPYFVRLPIIDLRQTVTYAKEGATLEDIYNSEIQTPVEVGVNKPLWRIIVHDHSTVVLSCHHSITDGRGTLGFHGSLLSALNNVASVSSNDAPATSFVITTPEDLTISPPLEKLAKTTMSFKTFVHGLVKLLVPEQFHAEHSAWTGHPTPAQATLQSSVRIRWIEPANARTLLKLCREHESTITSFLHTLCVYVLSHLISKRFSAGKEKRAFKSLSTMVPVDERRFTGTPMSTMTCQAGMYQAVVPMLNTTSLPYPATKSQFPWTKAKEYRDVMHSNLHTTLELISLIALLYRLPGDQFKAYHLDLLNKKREETVELSNLGQLAAPANSNIATWKVENVAFAQCFPTLGGMRLSVASAPDGRLSITYAWGIGPWDDELVEEFIAGMQESILAISKN